ncbi:hypothetical protein ACMA1I_06070 [Pontibacter sp. 13R65]|uniref:hypothetical protein n=1 Tax=Pontibacter sp. 13R65 TaxID=3127458 RepID=UPI00301D1F82
MPVSRNRKKKNTYTNNHKFKTASILSLEDILNINMNTCRKCGGKRDEFLYEELSEKEQIHWRESGIVDLINYFLLCPNCDEYSAIFDMEEF